MVVNSIKIDLLKSFVEMIENDNYKYLSNIDNKESIENILNDDAARAVIEQVKGLLYGKSLYEQMTIDDVKAILYECILYYFEIIEDEIARKHLIPRIVKRIP
jgi:alpha-galactosidase